MSADLIAFLAMAVGGTLVPLLVQRMRIDHRVMRMKRVPIAKLAENERGKIGGPIRVLDGTTTAPLSERTCVCYRVEVRNVHQQEVFSETGGVPFVVEDDTGTAIVDPKAAEVKRVWNNVWGAPSTFHRERVAALFKRHGYRDPVPPHRDTIRLTEVILEPGDVIDVVGAGISEPDPEGASDGYRSTKTRIRMVGSAKSPVWIVRDRRAT
jgi:hypothetical protein